NDGIAPLPGHISQVVLNLLRAENFLLAHTDVIFRRFGVPFARYLENLVRIAQRLRRGCHHAEYAAQRGGILLHLLALLLGQVGLRLPHDRSEVVTEIVVCETLYLRKSSALYSV